MSTLEIIANFFAYFCFTLGTLIIWPSKRNVIVWLQVPFFIVAYLIPLLAINYRDIASQDTIASLTWMNFWGSLFTLAGMVVANRYADRLRFNGRFRLFRAYQDPAVSVRRTFNMLMVGCAVMTLCFAWMRVFPAFAEVPFLAKFFKGPYKEKYDQVSVAYRFSQVMISTALPLAMVFYMETRQKKLLLPILWAVALFALALNRGPALAGVVLVTAVWASRTRLRMTLFLLISTALFCFGSSIYFILGIVLGDDESIWTQIARGAPDITDNLVFLAKFDARTSLSHGLTFIGGLVPGNFVYNPAVYTLSVVNDTSDISGIASGGLRLPPSISGYMAFGWPGVFAVSLVVGLFTGYYTARLRKMEARNLSQQVATLIWYQVYASFWIAFYVLTYQAAIAIFLFFYLVPNVSVLANLRLASGADRRKSRWRTRFRSRPAQPVAVRGPLQPPPDGRSIS